MRLDCLDFGFVELVDHMGSDSRIVDSARRSYGEGTKHVSSDRNLLRYMLENGHTSPFESCVLTFHIRTPIFVARQWMRHRTWSYNELSARYSVMPDEYFVPETARLQSSVNKQASEGEMDDEELIGTFHAATYHVREVYDKALEKGMSRELARTILPVSQYTDFYGTVNLHNLFRFLKLRNHPHAQPEIRVYARAIEHIVSELYPISYEAYCDYIRDAENFSFREITAIKSCLNKELLKEVVEGLVKTKTFSKGEASRFMSKLYGDDDIC